MSLTEKQKKKKKGLLTRFLDWLTKGVLQAEKRGRDPGHC